MVCLSWVWVLFDLFGGFGFVRYFRLLYCCLMLGCGDFVGLGGLFLLALFGLFVLLVKLFVVMFVVYLFSLFVGGLFVCWLV